MLLIEIVKSILTEGKASSFLKFYAELSRGYDPDDAVLFDCLMTLREYYESYMEWYAKFPQKKKEDRELVPHFEKRLSEIRTALHSDDKKRKIIAIDNGINQWHIDMPIIRHLQMGCEDGGDDIGPEEKEWMDVEELLVKLGKLTPRKQGPYKRIYKESATFGQLHNYWVERNGKAHKVGNHESYARLVSKDENPANAYKWMHAHGYARVIIEGNEIYVETSYEGSVNLSRAQKEWLKLMRDEIYPAFDLQIVNRYGRPIDI